MRTLSSLLPALAAMWLACAPVCASAAVTASPSSLEASLSSTLPTTITWTVSIPANPNAAFFGASLLSPSATITTPSGKVLQVDTTPLTVVVPAGGQGRAVESFTLAPATIAEALHLGINTLYLTRDFGPIKGPVVAIHIGGSGSGPLALSRVTLSFDDRALSRLLGPGEAATAIAEIVYSGSGQLEGLWEVAAPPSTLGEPVFIPLQTVSLNLSGGGQTSITSPPLPASLAGHYYARFVVRSPKVPFSGLMIEYAVEDEQTDVAPIDVVAPEQNAVLVSQTLFQWKPAAGAVSYRIEFFAADSSPEETEPVAGEWVTAAQRDAILSTLAQTHLEGGRSYQWRLIGFDDQGEVVGRSAMYAIRTP